MGPTYFSVWYTGKEKVAKHCFFLTTHANCSVLNNGISIHSIYWTLLMWTVQENYTVHLKSNEQCNSLCTVHVWNVLFTWTVQTCTVHVTSFFCVLIFLTVFFLNSIEWIKFIRTVISILYLIIFYLRSKNYGNCSFCRMYFVRNGIINGFME